MRIGIMGGTFNPVHLGHIAIARYAKEAFALDQVMLMPLGQAPHKDCREIATGEQRLKMCELSVIGEEGFVVSDLEVKRAGTTYTVDTLTQLHETDGGKNEYHFIIGTDTLLTLDTWRNFPRVAQLTDFIVLFRPGEDEQAQKEKAEQLQRDFGAVIRFGAFTGPDISSTAIRKAVADGESIEGTVASGVEDYIRKTGLYQRKAMLSVDEMKQKLSEALRPKRLAHVYRTCDTAMAMAEKFGADLQKTRVAALLHDCAKQTGLDLMKEYAMKSGFADEELLAFCEENDCPDLLHGAAGAYLAKEEYGVTDPEILSAIGWHTLGKETMSLLEMIIYTADVIEPGRDWPGIEKVRETAMTDPEEGTRQCAGRGVAYLLATDRPVHPNVIKMWNRMTARKGASSGKGENQ